MEGLSCLTSIYIYRNVKSKGDWLGRWCMLGTAKKPLGRVRGEGTEV